MYKKLTNRRLFINRSFKTFFFNFHVSMRDSFLKACLHTYFSVPSCNIAYRYTNIEDIVDINQNSNPNHNSCRKS